MMHKPQRKIPYLLLAGSTLLLYLPVASLRFAIKNDLFTGYFPARFHLSSFLHEGLFPLWDPWINYGLPLYGDITATAWNPLTILIASTVGYNAYSMTAEVLLAIFVAGAAMNALCERLGFAEKTSLMAAIVYMSCGYFIGDLQHLNWIWGAALLPWCAIGFLRFTGSGKWRDLPSALLPFMLFLTSAHPGLMIGSAYLFLFWSIAQCMGTSPHGQTAKTLAPLRRATILALALTVASLGIAYGYGLNLILSTRAPGDFLPGHSHGAFTPGSWISAILPFATTTSSSSFFGTDVALRNGYIGLLPLGLVAYAWVYQRTRWTIFWTGVIAFFLIVASGTMPGKGLTGILPLLGQVRLESEFRIFAMFAGIILATTILDQALKGDGLSGMRIAAIMRILFYAFVSIAGIALAAMLFLKQGVIFQVSYGSDLKSLLHAIEPTDTILLQALLQALICLGFWRCFMAPSKAAKRLVLIVAIEMTLVSWLNLPFTGVGSRSVADMQTLIERSPKGLPLPALQSTSTIVSSYPATDSIIGNWGLYSKQIAWRQKAPYPMILSESREFFPVTADSLLDNPMIFSSDKTWRADSILDWKPDHIAFKVQMSTAQTLGIKINHHPGWLAMVDGKPASTRTAWNGLNAVDVEAGTHKVELYFQDNLARVAQVYHFIVLLLFIALFLRTYRTRTASA